MKIIEKVSITVVDELLASILVDWIIENKIIEFIFTENPHSELIKRTLNIF
jgi:ATP:corrinoid adenosyltransferase